ncbi:hypothetical protein FRC01_010956 [Tulasnella sp. 417]|nr:hypothetical protein FRC01_010956 [Tulasnella sp. 417]
MSGNGGLAGSGGLVGLGLELYRVISTIRWPGPREDLIQFYLMVHLFEEDKRLNPHLYGEDGKYQPFFMDAARDQMKVVMEQLGLDPRGNPEIRKRWENAEKSKNEYSEINSPNQTSRQSSTPQTTSRRSSTPQTTLKIKISYGTLSPVEDRKLGMIGGPSELGPTLRVVVTWNNVPTVFSSLFEHWYLSAFLSYALAHPEKLEQGSQDEPIKRQAMDSTYLKSIVSAGSAEEGRTYWIPLDYHDRMTVKECNERMGAQRATEIRFISRTTRFVLMAAYDQSTTRVAEHLVDLNNKEGGKLLEPLKRAELRKFVSATAAPYAYTQDNGTPPEDTTPLKDTGILVKLHNKKAFKALEPRTCLLLLGPDPFKKP